MKKKKNLKTTAAAIIAGFMAGCAFTPEENEVPAVYGPPSDFEYDPAENEPEDVYGPPPYEEETIEEIPADYEAENNENPGVYGPPPGDHSAQ